MERVSHPSYARDRWSLYVALLLAFVIQVAISLIAMYFDLKVGGALVMIAGHVVTVLIIARGWIEVLTTHRHGRLTWGGVVIVIVIFIFNIIHWLS